MPNLGLVPGSPHRRSPRNSRSIWTVGLVLAALLALAAAWRWSPLSELADVSGLIGWILSFRDDWVMVAAVMGVFIIGSLVMFPVTVLIVVAGLLFGPWEGFAIATTGSLLGALAGYCAGAVFGKSLIARFSNGWMRSLDEKIARKGILAVAVIRILPIAPFTLVNLAAGASKVGFRDYAIGSIVGMVPGIAALTLFARQLRRTFETPDALNVGVLVVLVLALTIGTRWLWKRYGARAHSAEGGH